MKNILFLTCTFLTFQSFSQSAIDGFLKGKNTLDLALSGSYQTADNYFGNSGNLNFSRDFVIANLFGEYGITEKIDLIATIPNLSGKFQDGAVYGKYKFAELGIKNQKLSFLTAIGASAPLSKYETQALTAIGQRATQFHGHLVLQTTLPAGFYWQIQGAYHYALNPVPSSFTFSSKLMYTYKKLYLDFWYENQQGLGTNTYPSGVDFRTLTVDYQKIGGVIFYNLKNNWGTFVNASYIFKGLDTFNSKTISVGVTKKMVFKGKP
ncbi:MAG: hypothetical protein WC044_11355 [Crocinitomicaceae bacterium]